MRQDAVRLTKNTDPVNHLSPRARTIVKESRAIRERRSSTMPTTKNIQKNLRRLSAPLWGLLMLFAAAPASAQDHLIFCNTPEKMGMPGTYADAPLIGGRVYTIFFHYRNTTADSGPFVVALHGSKGKALNLQVRKGIADPRRDPSLAGRQAMARFLSSGNKSYTGKGGARFAFPLGRQQVASGILTVRTDQDVRLRIYFRHSRWTAPGMRVVAVDTPRREVNIALSEDSARQSFRIGEPDPGTSRHMDGTYGMLYAFKVNAPEGSRIRVSFSPRGGKAGLVGSVNGALRQTRIVPATSWKVFCEAVVGKNGVILTTAPFGGVFYPVELLFQLL